MNNTVKVALLIAVIVACLGFVVYRVLNTGKPRNQVPVNSEKDMYCLECKKPYKAKVDEVAYMPLMMGGVNAQPKHTCSTCNKAAGVAALKCASCGELVPSPGMQRMMMPGAGGGRPKAPACPKCGKPLTMGTPPAPAPAAKK